MLFLTVFYFVIGFVATVLALYFEAKIANHKFPEMTGVFAFFTWPAYVPVALVILFSIWLSRKFK